MTDERSFNCAFDHRLTSVPVARRSIRSWTRSLGLTADMVDRASSATSEIVTNAVVHAATGFQLSASWCPPTLHVEVADHAPMRIAESERHAELGGWGLHIVDRLTTMWGVEPEADGKVVWFEIEEISPPVT